jgi:hypothetical protein
MTATVRGAGSAGTWQGPVRGVQQLLAQGLICTEAGTQGGAGTSPRSPYCTRVTHASHTAQQRGAHLKTIYGSLTALALSFLPATPCLPANAQVTP